MSDIRETVRQRYAQLATDCCSPSDSAPCCGGATPPAETSVFGAHLYDAADLGLIPAGAAGISLGCGNPTAIAGLHAGETVLYLGCGGGIDVLLAARRVGPTGLVYGVDMTPEMLELAQANAAEAGVDNAEFRQGTIEDLPLDDASIDVVISNCVINLSPDKAAAIGEIFRVLRPGGRVTVSDVVAEDHLSQDERVARGDYAGCIAGALTRSEYLALLAAAGFTDASVTFTHAVADAMHGATIHATKPTR